MKSFKQYDLVLVNLDPTVGSEMKKTRPCVVLSPNELNRNVETVVVAPITTHARAYPTRVPVRSTKEPSWVVLDQIRALDNGRVISRLGRLHPVEVKAVKDVLRTTFVD
jgi:mRNA interferase MazF